MAAKRLRAQRRHVDLERLDWYMMAEEGALKCCYWVIYPVIWKSKLKNAAQQNSCWVVPLQEYPVPVPQSLR